ncbi:MAG: hypothetical protein KAJ29_04320 [Alphaproteobacteria bacterium]|nr:hypothetical protein [Alphaproteobacteria bacterium]
MSKEYAKNKIKDALKLCNGNMSLVRQQIVALAQEDLDLLKALVRPHLEGIVAYQVERVASGRAEEEKDHPDVPLPKIDEEFGMKLLRAAVAQDVTVFGRDEMRAPRKRKIASKQHIEAIHKMASSRRQRDKDKRDKDK